MKFEFITVGDNYSEGASIDQFSSRSNLFIQQKQHKQQKQLIKAAGRAAFLATTKQRKGRKGSNK